MEKRKWYDKDIETSLLGFGAMRLSTIDGEIDEEKGFKLFDMAIKNGVNYFDTAYPYTNRKNETFVGKALKRYPRDKFYLATKLSLNSFETKEEALGSIDMQLKALQMDYVDFYLIHALSKTTFKKFKDWDLLKEVIKWKEEGKIRHIGFSFHDDYETFKEILDYYDWEFVQIQLNYMDVDIQQGIQGYYDLLNRGIPVVVMEPVKGGKLANFNSEVAKDFKNYSSDSLAKWALRWVGSLEGVKVILSGMNEISQLEDNLKTFKEFQPLNEEEQKIVSGVREKLKNITKVGCTNCKYCLPCPNGVNIPKNFSIYNDYYMYNDKNSSNWSFNILKKDNATFDSCVGCGLCSTKCPQGIEIPESLLKMKEDMNFLK